MILKENEVRIYCNVKSKFLPFEKELIKLFKDNGFKCWASGYGCGVRDLCFDKKLPTAKMVRQLAKELENNIENSQVESQDSTNLLDMEIKS